METKQKDYLYERFCQDARFIGDDAPHAYFIRCGNKILRSNDTEDLFKQYIEAKEELVD